MTAIAATERKEWKQLPATQEFLQMLKESRQETLELWASGCFVGETAEESMAKNATALGGIQVLKQLIDMIENPGE